MASEAPRRGSAQQPFDVAIVGGGVNGAGIARDAAGRGLSVLLCERDDLAQHTSSSSTKLIHGGLRYLEYYEFGLVRKSLQEREVLLRAAPHIIWPLRFVMPHDASMRPQWMIRAGLFLYDHLARRELLPASQVVDLRSHPAGEPLRPVFGRGFMYSDGWVDDARLVVLNALDAHERGAAVATRTRCAHAARVDSGSSRLWRLDLAADSGAATVHARALVNAAGPWAAEFLSGALGLHSVRRLRHVKGSHIVVPAMFTHPYAYIFQNPDKRIIFAIPFEGRFTLIGTTDVEFDGNPARVAIDENETAYLCESASRYFRHPVAPADVVWSYSGVRPLLDDDSGPASAVTRDYSVELDVDGAPLLTVFGGKITTYRKLAEEAIDRLLEQLGAHAPAWTAGSGRGGPPHLPGGDMPDADFERFAAELAARVHWMAPATVRRLARAYGTRVSQVLGDARAAGDLGREVAPGLHEAELDYLVEREWACDAQDVLWRRSKLGLHLSADERRSVADWFEARAHLSPRAHT
jgi:glycerol-3-phosphate dehydrogenase